MNLMKFENLRLGTRLAMGFTIVLVLLVSIAGAGSLQLRSVSSEVTDMVDNVWQKERLFSEWAANTSINGARTIAVAESNDPARQQQVQARIKVTSSRISEIQKALEAFEKSPAEAALFADVGEKRKIYIAARDQVFREKEANEENARMLVQSTLEPALDAYVAVIVKMSSYHAAAISGMAKEIVAQSGVSQWILNVLGILAMVLGIAVAAVITRSVKKQLGGEPSHAVEIANRIAAGDLTQAIDIKAGDQASLLHAMQRMQQQLVGMVAQVRGGTDAIAIASGEIAAGNHDLSARTEQQAASLEETASSMEELTSAVKQNVDNARQANQLAAAASDVAIKGGNVVGQVIETMGEINESAKRIADITGVIDGIAFQTNILALNAAVEAARAGEQGRGFAVVAAEVRNLAQRSAAAAKEIKALIGDSVTKVGNGTSLVGQAGATMDDVVTSVRRVTDIMAEITTASQEQGAGIEQVNQAITQMDQVTQQNAALVEEAAAAAESMQEQAAKLAEVVSVFKLDAAGLLRPALGLR